MKRVRRCPHDLSHTAGWGSNRNVRYSNAYACVALPAGPAG